MSTYTCAVTCADDEIAVAISKLCGQLCRQVSRQLKNMSLCDQVSRHLKIMWLIMWSNISSSRNYVVNYVVKVSRHLKNISFM